VSDEPDTVILTYREEGGIDRRRLSGILGAATTLLLILLIVGLSLGALGAVGIGIGGFVIEFSDVTAGSGAVYPALAQQSECDTAPQLMATLDGQAQIDGYFQISKGIPVPGSTIDGVSVDIMSQAGNNSSINAENLDLYLTALSSAQLALGETQISERGPSENRTVTMQELYAESDENTSSESFRPGFGVDASGGFGVLDGRAIVYQIAFDNIEIGSISVSGSTYDAGDATLAGGYECDQLRPPERNNNSEFVLPGEGNVTSRTQPAGAGQPEDIEPSENRTDSSPTTGASEADPSAETDEPEQETGNETTEVDQQDEPEGEPEIEVTDVTPPQDTEIEVGDDVVVELTVSNVGNATETWEVYMSVDDSDGGNSTVDSESVSLEPGEGTDVTLEHEATPSDLPRVDAVVGIDTQN
jgi:hypothetical protein